MSKINCPHCGTLTGEMKHERVTEHFLCDECNSIFETTNENGVIQIKVQG